MMNKIDNSGQGLAKLGRDEDQYMAHVAQGEMVVPPIISPETRARIEAEMKAVGLSPDEYTVGAGMSINPITGMPEFGWLKKTFKSVKKVVKKVAPIAINFIPGVGPVAKAALTAVAGKASGLSTKEALLGGALSFAGGKLFGGAGSAATGAADAAKGNIFQRLKSGIGSYFNPAEGTKGIFGGTIGPGIRRGIGSLFGGGMGQQPTQVLDEAGNPTDLYQLPDGRQLTTEQMIAEGYLDQSGNVITSQPSGQFMDGKTLSQFLSAKFLPQSVEDVLGTGPGGGGLGSLIGGAGGGGMGGGLGAAALAGLLGKITYESAKERMGGLAETPAVTMDALGRYQLAKELGTDGTRGEFGLGPAPKALEFAGGGPVYGYEGGGIVRQYFNMGGVAELDMRDGGESAGPGTGTSDDIPAMLSDGEYVMTAKATRGAGAFNVKKNKSGIELVQGGKPSRKKGVENMRELMDIFEAI
jgi:hypothetical protein